MDQRAVRLGLNEAVFREVNERLTALSRDFGLQQTHLDLVCECVDRDCVERIRVSREEYESLRADPSHFAIHPGHAHALVEHVVETHRGYEIVEKRTGGAREVAENLNPRQR